MRFRDSHYINISIVNNMPLDLFRTNVWKVTISTCPGPQKKKFGDFTHWRKMTKYTHTSRASITKLIASSNIPSLSRFALSNGILHCITWRDYCIHWSFMPNLHSIRDRPYRTPGPAGKPDHGSSVWKWHKKKYLRICLVRIGQRSNDRFIM